MNKWLFALRKLLFYRKSEVDLKEEIEFHIQMSTEQNLKQGMDPETARREALRKFGGVEQVKEETRNVWGFRLLQYEFLLAFRRLSRNRSQNILMFVTFSGCLGLSLLSWSLFHKVMLSRPDWDPKGDYFILGYADSLAADRKGSTFEEMEAYRLNQEVFSDFAVVNLFHSSFLKTPGGMGRFSGSYLSSRAMEILNAQPMLGRLFTPEDDVPGAPPAVILSQRIWEHHFDADPEISGTLLEVTGTPHTVVGVLPSHFRFPNDQDFWLNYGSAPNHPRFPLRRALVKLKPGVTIDQAEAQMHQILLGLGADSPANKNGYIPKLHSYRTLQLYPRIRMSGIILLSLSLVFVLVSCANSANLLLIDFLGRRAEIASALALGVPRAALIRSVFWQVAFITLASLILSLALLPLLGPVLFNRFEMIHSPYWMEFQFQWHYLWLGVGLALFSALATLSGPVLYLLFLNPERIIRGNGDSNRTSSRSSLRKLLLAGQICLLTLLGISSGLLVLSSLNVSSAHWGYAADKIFHGSMGTRSIQWNREDYKVVRYHLHLDSLQAIENRPGTYAAALSDRTPGYSTPPNATYALDPASFQDGDGEGSVITGKVTEDYFKVMEVPILQGATLPNKHSGEEPVPAVINESLADRLWPEGDPLQRLLYIQYGWMDEGQYRKVSVAGVAGDFQASGPVAEVNDYIFTPFLLSEGSSSTLKVYVRDKVGAPSFEEINDVIHGVDSRISFYFPTILRRQIVQVLNPVRITTQLTFVFAVIAMLMCAIGVYSLTVTHVLHSSREFGIRMALGGAPQRLWREFTRGHMFYTLLGVLFGVIVTSQLVRFFGSILHEVQPYDWRIYAGVSVSILLLAFLACIPSLFMLKRINPSNCLKSF